MFEPTLSDIREAVFRFFHDGLALSFATRTLRAVLLRGMPTSLPGLPHVRAAGTYALTRGVPARSSACHAMDLEATNAIAGGASRRACQMHATPVYSHST